MTHYETLGVTRDASQDEIKKAYRKLAAQHHPDRGGDTAKFQEIQSAYAILSDIDKKSEYDNPHTQNFPGSGGFHFHGGGMPQGFEDIFGQMFGGAHPFGHMFNGGRNSPRNRTLNIQTTITLEEAFHGKDMIANLQLPSGREQVLEIKIPAGIQDGMTLRLSEMGDDSVPNVPKGDIHMIISVLPHSVFTRQGDDLVKTVNINCIDAMLGKTVQISTIDNKLLDIKINPGTQQGQTLAAAGYGMPKVNDNRFKGRLLLTINITIPTDLSEAQKAILSQINI